MAVGCGISYNRQYEAIVQSGTARNANAPHSVGCGTRQPDFGRRGAISSLHSRRGSVIEAAA
jgi:hypothetical protein